VFGDGYCQTLTIARLRQELTTLQAAHGRLEPLIAAALALADRLSQDDRCDEEQEELCRAVEDYRAKGDE